MQKRRTVTALILTLTLSVVLTSCGGKQYEGRKAKQKTPADVTRPVDKEIMRPGEGLPASLGSPARSASMDVVSKGKVLFDNGDMNGALGKFQEAVVIDSTNGVAYYYLAKARAMSGQHREALGILEKAESILGLQDEWKEAIELLRVQIREEMGVIQAPRQASPSILQL